MHRIAEEDFRGGVGKTLIKLRLHEEKPLDRMDGGAVLSLSVMGCIAKHCPNLRSLGHDLEPNGQEWIISSPVFQHEI